MVNIFFFLVWPVGEYPFQTVYKYNNDFFNRTRNIYFI